VDKESKETRKFMEDLKDIHGAARVELSFLTAEVNKISANVRKLERELKSAKISTKDRFETVMAPFHRVAAEKAEELNQRLRYVEEQASKLAYMFGEDPKSMPMGEMFSIFSTFVADYRKAEIYLQKKVEAEEKNRKRKLADEMRKAAAASKKQLTRESSGSIQIDEQKLPVTTNNNPEEKKNEPIVDKVVGALQGDAGSIRQLIRARRRKAGAGRARRGSNLQPDELGQSKHKQSLPDLSEDDNSGHGQTISTPLNSTKSLKSSSPQTSPRMGPIPSGPMPKPPSTPANNNIPKPTKRKKKSYMASYR